jgi:2-C-methyl-D-erythritol 4-phosphate cytidylyltransferase/2-C-methyl-D-erythritol 2,4-cyclodiphosphate synthase
MTEVPVTALIVAAGSGQRLGGGVPKQYRPLGGKALLARAVEPFLAHPRVNQVRVVIGDGQQALASRTLADFDIGEPIIGGAERHQSVINGLKNVVEGIVLVHDAARLFCSASVIDRLLDALPNADGAVPVLPVSDTLATGGTVLDGPVDRSKLLRVQTPQAFHAEDLLYAYEQFRGDRPTDESSVMLAAGLKVTTVQGDIMLEKLTTGQDWARAEALLAARLVSRTGSGFDVHAFAGDGPIMLGGVEIPHDRGLAGHSDADVALHAITDALLGAAALGDIGEHFRPSDPQWKGASSDRFLAFAAELIRARGGIIDHVDCTIICEAPKVGPFRAAMRSRIAAILEVADANVSVKATTTERLGFTGRREGIAAQAIASIRLEAS